MPLVRCSCLVEVDVERVDVVVKVLDPACGYVVHRMGALFDAAADAGPGLA